MAPSEFFSKLTSRYLWLNLAGILAVIIVLCVGAQVMMGVYTHHGEAIALPDVRKHSYESAVAVLEDLGMEAQVTDTGYVKTLPPGTILEMMPVAGTMVKSGRIVYLTINAANTPTLTLPDVIDNSSLREARAKLMSMGFKVGEPQYVFGEKDWVYGILVNGHNVTAGQRISIEATLVIQVGNGQRDAADTIFMTDAPPQEYYEEEYIDGSGAEGGAGEADVFEEVKIEN
jgi:beta-lactam-binding protein with PASTA domain